MATARSPAELEAREKAQSASEKTTPPWPTPKKLRWSALISSATTISSSVTETSSTPSFIA